MFVWKDENKQKETEDDPFKKRKKTLGVAMDTVNTIGTLHLVVCSGILDSIYF